MKNPNGYGTVYKLSGNRRRPFVARVTTGWHEGKQLVKTIGYFKTRKDANMALAEYNSSPYDIDAKKLTFTEVYEQWSERRYPDLSENRVEQYKSIYRKVSEFHEVPFVNIKLAHLQKYFDGRTDISSASLKPYRTFFNQLYQYALKHEITDKNYADYIEIRETEKAKPHKIFTPEEIWKLWDNHHRADVKLVLILVYSGLRISELLQMRRENVNLEERYMIGGLKTEAGRDRVVPINKRILPFVAELMEMETTSAYLLPHPKGRKTAQSYSTFRHSVWKPLLEEFGMDNAIHDTRHTFVSLMDAAGANKIALKRIVGHRDSDVTAGYTHKSIEELVAEVDLI
jgi:integrase